MTRMVLAVSVPIVMLIVSAAPANATVVTGTGGADRDTVSVNLVGDGVSFRGAGDNGRHLPTGILPGQDFLVVATTSGSDLGADIIVGDLILQNCRRELIGSEICNATASVSLSTSAVAPSPPMDVVTRVQVTGPSSVSADFHAFGIEVGGTLQGHGTAIIDLALDACPLGPCWDVITVNATFGPIAGAVPEPTTLLLLGSVVSAGIVFSRRRHVTGREDDHRASSPPL